MKLENKFKKFIILFLIIIVISLSFSHSEAIDLSAYFMTSSNFNIWGDGVQTTFSDRGYDTVLKVDGREYTVTNGEGEGDSVVCKTELPIISGGSYVNVTFKITNNGTTTKTVGVATYSDIQIHNDDYATVTNLEDDNGFIMTDGTYSFNFLGRNSYKVTDVDAYWFGFYQDRISNKWSDYHPSVLEGKDSGMAFSWDNRQIEPNETLTFSVAIGIGILNSPPTITVTSPIEEKYLAKNQMYIEGKVNDADLEDVVTISYAFDGGEENVLDIKTPAGVETDYSKYLSFPSDIERGEHYLEIWAMDDKSNMSKTLKFTFFVETDYEAPTATHTLSPSGWTNQNVTITLNVQDDISGVKQIKKPDGTIVTTTTVQYEVSSNNDYVFVLEDNAGNVRNYTVSVTKIEREKPTVVVNPQQKDWCQTVDVNITFSDTGGSGFKNYQYAITEGRDGALTWSSTSEQSTAKITINNQGTKYLHLKAIDNAGNIMEDTVFGPYCIDTTKPTITADPQTCEWKPSIEVNLTFADQGGSEFKNYQYEITQSQTKPQTPNWSAEFTEKTGKVTINSDGTHYLHVKAVDNAGNIKEETFGPYKIDTQAPTITANPSSCEWRPSVDINLSFSDAGGSEFKNYQYEITQSQTKPQTPNWSAASTEKTGKITINSDGTHYLHVKAVDNAGNVKEQTFGPYKIDTQAPTITANPSSCEWKSSVDINLSFSDAGGSEFKNYQYEITQSQTKPQTPHWSTEFTGKTGKVTINSDGTHYLHVKVVDNAGNVKEQTFGPYKIDTQAPTITANPSSCEWRPSVDINLSFSDAGGSEFKNYQYEITQSETKPQTPKWSTEFTEKTGKITINSDGIHYLHVKAVDNAGNVKEQTFGPYKIDTQAPTITANPSSCEWKPSIEITLSFSDAGGSEFKNYQYEITQSKDKSSSPKWSTESTEKTGKVTINSDGTHYLHVKAVDNAGNVKEQTFGPYKIDTQAPTITANPSSCEWRPSVDINLSFSDAGGSEFKNYQYEITQSKDKSSSPKWSTESTEKTGKITINSDGTHYLHVKAVDNAGNVKEQTFGPYKIDTQAPVITANPSSCEWKPSIEITLSFSDAGGSEFKNYQYEITQSQTKPQTPHWSTESTEKTGKVTINSDGTHYLHVKAVDNAGNVKEQTFGPYKIDTQAPVITANPPSCEWRPSVDINLSFTDAGGSEFKNYQYEITQSETKPQNPNWSAASVEKTGKITINSDGIHYLHVKAVDNAGNVKEQTFGPYKIDTQAPTITANPPSCEWRPSVDITLSFSDAGGSEFKNYQYEITQSETKPQTPKWSTESTEKTGKITINSDGIHYLHVKAVDNAGNVKEQTFGPYKIDTQAPTITANPSSCEWRPSVDINLSFTDAGGSEFKNYQYEITQSKDKSSSPKWSVESTNSTATIHIQEDGVHYLHVKAVDNAGNVKEQTFGPYKIDTQAPTIVADPISCEWKPLIDIKLTFTDAGGSDYKNYQYEITKSQEKPQTPHWSTESTDRTATIHIQEDGIHYLHVKAVDNAGNVKEQTFGPYKIDTQAPVITANPSSCGWTPSIDINLSFTDAGGSEFKNYQYEITQSQEKPQTPHWSTESTDRTAIIHIQEDGVHYLHVKAVDNAGNVKEETFGPYRVDTVAPTVTVVPEECAWVQSIDVSLTFSDIGGSNFKNYQYVIKDSQEIPREEEWSEESIKAEDTIHIQIDGIQYLHIKAVDNAGNVSEDMIFGPYYIDYSIPTGTIEQNPKDWVIDFVDLEWSFSDDKSGLYKVILPNKQEVIEQASGVYTVTDNGTYTFTIYDKVGNYTSISKKISNIDKIAPKISLSQSLQDWTNGNIEITWDCRDDESGFNEVLLPNGQFSKESSGTFNVEKLGIYTFIAYDNVGNETEIQIEINNIDKKPPKLELSTDITEWTNGEVKIHWNSDDENSGLENVLLPNGQFTKEKSGDYVVKSNGQYTFVAYDQLGNSTIETIEVKNIDFIEPTVVLKENDILKIDGIMQIEWLVDDNLSGMKEIILPDGQISKSKEGIFEVTANGIYTFVVYDEAGNMGVETIEIKQFE